MNALVLNNGRLSLRPYHEWLTTAGFPGSLVLLASREQMDRHGEQLPEWGYVHAEAVATYDQSGRLEARAIELAGSYDLGYIIACQEQDLERAAALREILGLPGQDTDSATAFRDKLVMKERARAGGIKVASYRELQTPMDVLAFVREHGLPIVVKPRNGSASKGLHILHEPADVTRFLTCLDWSEDIQPNHLLEAYVHGDMYHVDGLVVDGRMVVGWPARYRYELASFASDDSPRFDVALDPDDPMTARLLAFTDRLFAVLPTPCHTSFHAEIFHTPADDLVLCEVASRNGGAWIKELIRAMFGFDLPTARVLAQLGLPLPVPADGDRPLPARIAGELLLLRRPGRVTSVPEHVPFPWVERYACFVRPGDTMTVATSSGDYMAAMVISGRSRAECEERMRQASEWFLAAVKLEPV